MANGFPGAAILPAALAAAWLACPPSCAAAEDYSAWSQSTGLTLNTSATGANVAGTVAGFPLLVRLTAGNFDFAQARADGRDIRFAKPGGAHLPYEIERWDAQRKLAEVWVRVDTVRGNDPSQSIRMYWGNAAAPDSSKPADVFRAADGYLAAWHLGGSGTADRPNAVAGGNPAQPVNYDGDEGTTGVIAGADSLDGAAAGDYLDLGDGYADFTGGFTFTVWAYPTAIKRWARALDLGSGPYADNIIVTRVDTTHALGFQNYVGTAAYGMPFAPNVWTVNQWQMIGVTVSGKTARFYRNGALVKTDSLTAGIANVIRTQCFLGRSNWPADEYYQGKFDEPELSRAAQGPDRMKLLYQNQKPGQAIPIVNRNNACAWRLSVTADTSAREGSVLTLPAQIQCASSFVWSVVSGPAARLLDPEQEDLAVPVPRVSRDTDLVFRLTAVFADSTRSRDVRVRVIEAIPDPEFTLPAAPAWDGTAPLAYRPAISNLAAIRASRDSVLHWAWSFTGPAVDTGWLSDGVLLKHAEAGELGIRLCLDNGGAALCREGTVAVSPAASLAVPPLRDAGLAPPVRDALGRPAGVRSRLRAYRASR